MAFRSEISERKITQRQIIKQMELFYQALAEIEVQRRKEKKSDISSLVKKLPHFSKEGLCNAFAFLQWRSFKYKIKYKNQDKNINWMTAFIGLKRNSIQYAAICYDAYHQTRLGLLQLTNDSELKDPVKKEIAKLNGLVNILYEKLKKCRAEYGELKKIMESDKKEESKELTDILKQIKRLELIHALVRSKREQKLEQCIQKQFSQEVWEAMILGKRIDVYSEFLVDVFNASQFLGLRNDGKVIQQSNFEELDQVLYTKPFLKNFNEDALSESIDAILIGVDKDSNDLIKLIQDDKFFEVDKKSDAETNQSPYQTFPIKIKIGKSLSEEELGKLLKNYYGTFIQENDIILFETELQERGHIYIAKYVNNTFLICNPGPFVIKKEVDDSKLGSELQNLLFGSSLSSYYKGMSITIYSTNKIKRSDPIEMIKKIDIERGRDPPASSQARNELRSWDIIKNDVFIAAKIGDVKSIQYLIPQNVNLISEFLNDLTPAMVAAENDQVVVLKKLCDAKADFDQTREDGWSAVMSSVFFGNKNALQFLISKNAKVNIPAMISMSVISELNIRPDFDPGTKEIADKILGMSSIMVTPLYIAILSHNEKIVEILLSNNADIYGIWGAVEGRKRHALDIAYKEKDPKIIAMIQQKHLQNMRQMAQDVLDSTRTYKKYSTIDLELKKMSDKKIDMDHIKDSGVKRGVVLSIACNAIIKAVDSKEKNYDAIMNQLKEPLGKMLEVVERKDYWTPHFLSSEDSLSNKIKDILQKKYYSFYTEVLTRAPEIKEPEHQPKLT
jgi:ankyrin repeat protein